MSGEQMYEAYRQSMQQTRRGLTPEPRWKDLKPWLKRVWNRTAENLSCEANG